MVETLVCDKVKKGPAQFVKEVGPENLSVS
jgi:hypothetical protein